MEDHKHNFPESSWPFADAINTAVYSTKQVAQQGYPILTVAHDHNGDWQFLCGETDDPEDMSIVCFGCMFELHPFISEFRDLPVGWLCWRDDVSEDWQSEELPPDEDWNRIPKQNRLSRRRNHQFEPVASNSNHRVTSHTGQLLSSSIQCIRPADSRLNVSKLRVWTGLRKSRVP